MIVYDLCCGVGHRFEGWFESSAEFARQQSRSLVACPHCGSPEVVKAPMAPAVPRKGNRATARKGDGASVPVAGGSPPPEVVLALLFLAEMQVVVFLCLFWVGVLF